MPDNSNNRVDLNDTSILRKQDDIAGEDALDRLENLTGGAQQPKAHTGRMARESDKLNASTEEEVDALRVNLTQDDDSRHNPRYGTGVVNDDLARDRMAGLTESGKELDDKGVNSVVPGRDNTSNVLRRHHPDSSRTRSQNVGEGNIEEPRDESINDRKVDEGTAA